MRAHVDVLARLHFVWGVFGVLTGASLVVLAIGTFASLLSHGPLGRAELAAVWVLVFCALLLMAVGASALFVGRSLRQRRTTARMMALVLAVPNLIVVPFGTALGVYTFWVLLNDDARSAFGRPPRAPSPARMTTEGA